MHGFVHVHCILQWNLILCIYACQNANWYTEYMYLKNVLGGVEVNFQRGRVVSIDSPVVKTVTIIVHVLM